MIFLISSSKPISKIRSASSMTKHIQLWYSKPSVRVMWSRRRPGVATNIVTPFTSFSFSAFRSAPPMTNPYVCVWYFINSFSTPNVCMDSSRVGEMMITPVPFRWRKLSLFSSSMTGMRNANVFPLPVRAEPIKSLKRPRSKCVQSLDGMEKTLRSKVLIDWLIDWFHANKQQHMIPRLIDWFDLIELHDSSIDW